jgi:hypothetical protein
LVGDPRRSSGAVVTGQSRSASRMLTRAQTMSRRLIHTGSASRHRRGTVHPKSKPPLWNRPPSIQVTTRNRQVEREIDEDITNMDTPIVVAYNSKIKLFFSIIIFNTCDEWTLHHNMRSMSFTEVLTWIKEGVDHAWKGWIMKHLN